MERLSEETVRRVAELARLELSADEIERMRDDLGKVVAHATKMGELDLDGVEATHHLEHEDRRRSDEIAPSLDPSTAVGDKGDERGFSVPGGGS